MKLAMILSDCHTHSSFSSDSTASMEDMVRQGIALGLTRLCFTEHMDYDYPVPEGEAPFLFEPEAYFETINRLKKKYGGSIQLLAGIELGLQPHLGEKLSALTARWPFDFVIGSSHVTEGADPYYPSYWNGTDPKEAVQRYYRGILKNIAACPCFDVYGHIDYILRYIPAPQTHPELFDPKTCAALTDRILTALIHAGKGIEINTGGFKYGLGHPNPHEELIQRYVELGGTILTIGSDAHTPEHLAYDFNRTRDLLLSLGIRSYTVFEGRKPVFLPL